MKFLKTTLALFVLGSAFAASASAQMQTLLAGYDFQTAGNTAAVSPNTPTSFTSPFGTQAGTAKLYLNGQFGSYAYDPATQLNAQNGSAINAGMGFSTTTTGASALNIINQTNSAGNSTSNNKRIVFALTMTEYQGLVITFASYRNGTGGFNNNTFSYSTDGTTFTPAGITIAQTTSATYELETADLSGITALNNAATVYIGYTLDYVNTSNGSGNRLDNFQFNATAVPEPSTYVGGCLALGCLGLEVLRRRRRQVR